MVKIKRIYPRDTNRCGELIGTLEKLKIESVKEFFRSKYNCEFVRESINDEYIELDIDFGNGNILNYLIEDDHL